MKKFSCYLCLLLLLLITGCQAEKLDTSQTEKTNTTVFSYEMWQKSGLTINMSQENFNEKFVKPINAKGLNYDGINGGGLSFNSDYISGGNDFYDDKLVTKYLNSIYIFDNRSKVKLPNDVKIGDSLETVLTSLNIEPFSIDRIKDNETYNILNNENSSEYIIAEKNEKYYILNWWYDTDKKIDNKTNYVSIEFSFNADGSLRSCQYSTCEITKKS